jgi:mycothiol synthase
VTEVSWRAAGPADAADLAGLFEAIQLAAPIGLETEPGEIAERLSMPRLDPRVDTLIGVDAERSPVAYAEAADMGTGAGQFRIRLTCALRPDAGGDQREYLLGWLIERARQMRAERHPDLAAVTSVRCAATDQARRDTLTAAGFEVDHWHHELTRDVAGPGEGRPLADGVLVVPYDSRYSEAARLAQNEAFADEPHGRLLDAREWPRYAVGLATFLPAATFLALDGTASPGEEVVAFVLSLEHHGLGGVRTGTLISVGTRSRWRGRGLATALIGRALAAYQQAGLSEARLEVCSHNDTAVSLYATLGFTASDRGYVVLMGPVR